MSCNLISIIIPVYNSERYLDKCLNSVLHQSYKNLEIILINDGSTDGTAKICDMWKSRDLRVKVIHKQNGGTQSAILEGLKIAKGNYIGFVDSDDFIAPNMYESLITIAEQYDVDCVMCNFNILDYNGHLLKTEDIPLAEGLYTGNTMNNFYDKLLPSFGPHNIEGVRWNKIFKKDIVDQYAFKSDINVIMGEDVVMINTLLLNCNSLYYLNACLYNCCRRTNNITSIYYNTATFEQKIYDYKAIISIYNRYFKNTSSFIVAKYIYFLRFFVFNCEIKYNIWKHHLKLAMSDSFIKKVLNDVKKSRMGLKHRVLFYFLRIRLFKLIYLILQ